MEKQKFDPRAGCLDFGTDYEYLMAAYYALKLSLYQDCIDFKLSTNNDDMGNFDDVVVEIQFASGENRLFALQLKHRADKECNLTIDSLITSSGDHSLQKYCNGFEEVRVKFKNPSIDFKNCHFILFTNGFIPTKPFESFDKIKKHKVLSDEIQMKKSGIFISRHDQCIGDNLINVTKAKEHFIYKFRTQKPDLLNSDFLNQFLLYTKQTNAKDIESLICNNINEIFMNVNMEVVVNYLNFFKYWCRGSFSNIKLTKADASLKLAEYLLTPNIPEIDLNKIKYTPGKSELVSDIIDAYDIVLIQDDNELSHPEEKILAAIIHKFPNLTHFRGLWSRPLTLHEDFKLLPDGTIPMSAQGQNFIEQSLKKIFIIMWHMNLVPLILKIDEASKETVLKTITRLCGYNNIKKKFVIFGGNIGKENFDDKWKIFASVSDMSKELREKFISSFTISLQNRQPISIQDLFVDDVLIETLTMNHILTLLEENFTVSTSRHEMLPKHYVSRSIPKVLIHPDVMKELKDDIFVLSCNSHVNEIKKYFNSNLVNLSKYLLLKNKKSSENYNIKQSSILDENNEISDNFIIYTNNICSIDMFNEVCSIDQKKTYHHLLVNSKKNLEWLCTNGSIEKLRNFRLANKNDLIKDFEILPYFRNQLNIICADPGLGKSVLFKYLKNNCPLTHWVITINLNDHVKFFKSIRSKDEIFDYLFKRETKTIFQQHILTILAAQKRIMFLWDGFDEIPIICTNNVISALQSLTSEGFPMWISSRNNSKEILENAFNSLSLRIQQYSISDQFQFVSDSLKEYVEDIDISIDKINENITNSLTCGYFDYSGNPLQIYMIVEIIKRNPKKYISELKLISLPDLYEEFMQGKFDDYFTKANANTPNSHMKNIQKTVKRAMLTQYQITALKASFDESVFDFIKIANADKIISEVINKKDNMGIIFGMTEDHKPIFSHKTFEEFLTAWWLSENYSSYPNLLNMIFQENYRNIRLMFDMILAKDCPVHLAVIYRNFQIVKKHADEISTSEDKGGRNALHLASSWGKYHNPMPIDKHQVDNTLKESDSEIHLQMIDFLVENNVRLDQRDNLMHMTPYEYAQVTSSLGILEKLLNHEDRPLTFPDISSVLYYSIKFNYSKIFFGIEDIPFVEFEEVGEKFTILQYATKMDRYEFVKHLLKFEAHRNTINQPYKELGSPLHTACLNKNMVIFKLLLENGASASNSIFPVLIAAIYAGQKSFCRELLDSGCSANVCNLDGFSALQVAAMQDQIEIMKLLLEYGADLNCITHDLTALNFCIDNDSVEGVKLLVERGADVNRQSNELIGYSSLHSASERGKVDIVKILLENNADASLKNTRLYTPLHVALINQHEAVAAELIKHQPSEIHGYSLEKSTPILLATLANFPRIIETLAKAGADVNSAKSNHSPLHIACLKNYKTCATILIKYRADVNRTDSSGNTPIFYAINDHEMLQLFLENSADINFQNKELGITPLHFAIYNEKIEAVEKLVANGANILTKNNKGESPLIYAIKQNNERILKILLSRNMILQNESEFLCTASINDAPSSLLLLLKYGLDVNSSDQLGRTSLHYASMKSPVSVKILLRNSADVNKLNNDRLSPLCFAVALGQTETIQELLQYHAHLDEGFGAISGLHLAAALGDITTLILLMPYSDINWINDQKQTALHFAVFGLQNDEIVRILHSLALKNAKVTFKLNYNQEDCMKELMSSGALVNLQDHKGSTALHYAVFKSSLSMIKALLDFDADITISNDEGESPLIHTILTGNLDAFKLLILGKSKQDIKQELQKCLFCASCKNDVKAIRLLFEEELVEPSQPDSNTSMTALHYATQSNSYEAVEYLIVKSCNLDAKAKNGITPLHLAILNNNLKIVKLLLDNNADVNLCDDLRSSPLHFSATRGLAMTEMLLERGALINAVNNEGDSALHEAMRSSNLKILEFLICNGGDANIINCSGKTALDL